LKTVQRFEKLNFILRKPASCGPGLLFYAEKTL